MATALQGFRLTGRSCTCRAATQYYMQISIGARALSTTSQRWGKTQRRAEAAREKVRAAALQPIQQKIQSSNSPEIRELRQLEQEWEEVDGQSDDVVENVFDELIEDEIQPSYPPYEMPPDSRRRKRETFMNMGEEEPWETEELMEDDDDDITSIGHGELERHREMRHYARLIAWEMPMLSKLAKPFVPPTKDMPLRFRYTSYMGEQHPAEKKVVVEFTTADMPNLSLIQREKLKKLVGVRYNPMTDIVKMSCESYETQAQNKRYLGNVIDSLLIEARDPKDTFEDVPLDTRHHFFKPRPRFPTEWQMTKARRQELEQTRYQQELNDQQRKLNGRLIDGIQQITEGLKKPIKVEDIPEMAMAGKGKGGKGAPKRLAVRR